MQTTNPLVVRIFYNSRHAPGQRQTGWSMRIPILEQSWPAALAIAQKIIAAARNICSASAYIVWATLGHAEYPWWQQSLITDPLYPLPQWGTSYTDLHGFWFNESDRSGNVQGRLFRAIDANELDEWYWQQWVHSLPVGIPALPLDLTTATKHQLFINAFCTFRQYFAVLRRQGPRVAGVQKYQLTTVADMLFDRVGSRRVGDIWHRQSWEALPRKAQPPFSPCGQVTGVGRRAFVVRARFYPDAPIGLIHYYRAKIDAEVFPLPHIWWGRFTEQDLFNSFGVGELTGNTRRWWVNGEEFGNAPGDHYSGPESGFTGEYVPAWSPIYPTPEALRPACDAPVKTPVDERHGCFCLGGPGIRVAYYPGP